MNALSGQYINNLREKQFLDLLLDKKYVLCNPSTILYYHNNTLQYFTNIIIVGMRKCNKTETHVRNRFVLACIHGASFYVDKPADV